MDWKVGAIKKNHVPGNDIREENLEMELWYYAKTRGEVLWGIMWRSALVH